MFEARENKTQPTITWGTAASPFGEIFVATSQLGICLLEFLASSVTDHFESLQNKYPDHQFRHHKPSAQKIAALICKGNTIQPTFQISPKGTPFQKRVWKQLLTIPHGKTITYSTLAHKIAHPKAARAVGNAVGRNPIALLIPCHRVIRNDGSIGGYRWGVEIKQAILACESKSKQ